MKCDVAVVDVAMCVIWDEKLPPIMGALGGICSHDESQRKLAFTWSVVPCRLLVMVRRQGMVLRG